MTKLWVGADSCWEVELDEEGERILALYEADEEDPDDRALDRYLASRIKVEGDDITYWHKVDE